MDAKSLLDSLMGTSRDKPQKEKRTDDWKEKNVCKFFLVGFCPTNQDDNWFHNTKSGAVDICRKVHSDALKADFEKHSERSKYQRDYERDFLKYLQGLIASADARITREKSNVSGSKTRNIVKVPASLTWQYDKLQADTRHAANDAAMLKRGGQADASKALAQRADKLAEDLRVFEETHTVVSAGDFVCDICGIRCSMDDERLYEGHVTSNLHKAYSQVRNKAKELQETLNSSQDQSSERVEDKEKDKDSSRGDRSDRDRDRAGRDRSSNRDRERAGDRHDRDSDDRSKRSSTRAVERDRDREQWGRRGSDRGSGDGERERRRSNRSRSR